MASPVISRGRIAGSHIRGRSLGTLPKRGHQCTGRETASAQQSRGSWTVTVVMWQRVVASDGSISPSLKTPAGETVLLLRPQDHL